MEYARWYQKLRITVTSTASRAGRHPGGERRGEARAEVLEVERGGARVGGGGRGGAAAVGAPVLPAAQSEQQRETSGEKPRSFYLSHSFVSPPRATNLGVELVGVRGVLRDERRRLDEAIGG